MPDNTNDTAVEIFNVPKLSPPVPTTSTVLSPEDIFKHFSLRISAPAAITIGLCFCILIAVKKDEICASVAFPDIII